jgi:hypothetical protein
MVLDDLLFAIFALVERKNGKQKIVKYRSAEGEKRL